MKELNNYLNNLFNWYRTIFLFIGILIGAFFSFIPLIIYGIKLIIEKILDDDTEI